MTESKGQIIDGKVTQKIAPAIERGALDAVHAIVMHQTGGSSAESTLASYGHKGANGAHFLIDTDGTIYQTAHVDKRTHHVGNIQSRCHNLKSCSPDDATAIDTILHPKKKKVPYSTKVRQLSDHEAKKAYPKRYPTNSDSLGIEVVGAFDGGIYDDPTSDQADSVKWLVAELLALFKLTTDDVYRH